MRDEPRQVRVSARGGKDAGAFQEEAGHLVSRQGKPPKVISLEGRLTPAAAKSEKGCQVGAP